MKSFKYMILDNLPTLFVGLLVAFAFVMVSNHARADDMTIEMLNKRDDGAKMVYSIDVAKIDVGNTITWLPTTKGHNVEFIAGPDGWDKPKKSKMNKEYSYTFEVPGIYLYQCTPHKGMGMIALVVVGGDVSNADAVAKTRVLDKSKKILPKLLADAQ